MRLAHTIVLATLNLDKFDEFKELFAAYPTLVLEPAAKQVRNSEGLKFVEKHDSYLENAVAKARLCNHASHYPALADDSGIEVEALGGKPGVHSHRYASPKAGMSQDQANTELLLKEIQAAGKSVEGTPARFVATLALVVEGILLHATGILEGTLTNRPRGTQGFGYDPIFIPKGSDKTFAEMTSPEKNKISHRAKALKNLMNQIEANGIVLAKP